MYTAKPSGEILGCRIEGLDLSQPFGEKELGFSLHCLAAYDGLPDEVKQRIEGRTATHNFEKFWEMMRQRGGARTSRAPLTEEQKRQKPPVSHPMVMVHPISGRRILYANPGYTVSIDGMDRQESDELLESL